VILHISIPNKVGFILQYIIDLFNRKVVSSAISDNLTTNDTVIKAWGMAIKNTILNQSLIFHSNRGVQYTSHKFTKLKNSYNGLVTQSMSRKGN